MEKSLYDKMVKRTVIYSISLWLVLFISASGWAYMAYGDYKEISAERVQITSKIEEIQKLEKEGMSFENYKAQSSVYQDDKNLVTIISVMEKDFFEGSFKNTESPTFDEFIKQKAKETEERLKSDEEVAMRNISSTVLPSFSLYDINMKEDNDFSELRFVNYVERIMQTFNLEYKGDIGIADVLPIEVEGQMSPENTNVSVSDSLDNKIFYIPLTFSLEGNKESIVDFIYFVEKVGNVNVASESLEIYSDNFFEKGDKNFRDTQLVLEGETKTEDYNPYLNQLIDIESIVFEEYIYEKSDGDIRGDFLSNIRKKPQGLDEFQVDVELRFYVKGISDFKVEEKYTETVLEVTSFTNDIQNAIKALQGLKTRDKTPEVALLIKRMVTYQSVVKLLEQNSKNFRELSPEQIYKDILSSLEVKKLLKNDLELTTGLTGLKLANSDESDNGESTEGEATEIGSPEDESSEGEE